MTEEKTSPKATSFDIYVLIKIISVLLCVGVFIIFYFSRKLVFVSDYDAFLNRIIFRNPSEVVEKYRKVKNAGGFWKNLNSGMTFFWLSAAVTNILKPAFDKTRAIIDILVSILLAISIPFYFVIGCVLSKSQINYTGAFILFVAVCVIEILFAIYYCVRFFKERNNFERTESSEIVRIIAVFMLLLFVYPSHLGLKAGKLAWDYYAENDYDVLAASTDMTDDMRGNLYNGTYISGDDIYVCGYDTVFKVEKDGSVSELFKANDYIYSYSVFNDRVCYILSDLTKKTIYCYDDSNGETKELVTADEINLFYILEGKLYYTTEVPALYCVDLSSDDLASELIFNDVRDSYIFQAHMYYGYDVDTLKNDPPLSSNLFLYKGIFYGKKMMTDNNYIDSILDSIGRNKISAWTHSDEPNGYIGNYKRDFLIKEIDEFNIFDDKIYFTRYEDGKCTVYTADLIGNDIQLIDTLDIGRADSIGITDDLIIVCSHHDVRVINR